MKNINIKQSNKIKEDTNTIDCIISSQQHNLLQIQLIASYLLNNTTSFVKRSVKYKYN